MAHDIVFIAISHQGENVFEFTFLTYQDKMGNQGHPFELVK
jgi:hypothetical protein